MSVGDAYSNMDEYKRNLVKSNEELPEEVTKLRDELAPGRNNREESTKYKLEDSLNLGNEESMQDRFSGRFSRNVSQQTEMTDADRMSQALTSRNRTKRINDVSDLMSQKGSFDTYTNLFSKYIGNLNAESSVKQNRAYSMNQALDKIDRDIVKNDMLAKKKERAYRSTFSGSFGAWTGWW